MQPPLEFLKLVSPGTFGEELDPTPEKCAVQRRKVRHSKRRRAACLEASPIFNHAARPKFLEFPRIGPLSRPRARLW
jgi:hypothetical protein